MFYALCFSITYKAYAEVYAHHLDQHLYGPFWAVHRWQCSPILRRNYSGEPTRHANACPGHHPLIRKQKESMSDATKIWYMYMYAGDASAPGKIDRLHTWWHQLNTLGPKFGYFTNPSKTCQGDLFISCCSSLCWHGFESHFRVQMVRLYLGVVLSMEEYMHAFVNDKVKQWADELGRIAMIACSQPHAAHACSIHSWDG